MDTFNGFVKANIIRLGDRRGIGSLPVLYKLYSKVLGRLAGLRDLPLSVPRYAFRTGYSADELLGVLRHRVGLDDFPPMALVLGVTGLRLFQLAG